MTLGSRCSELMRRYSLVFGAALAISILCAVVVGCQRSIPVGPTAELPTEEALLGPGDLFEVRVYNEKELTGNYQVGPDGTISFPFLGVLTVSGKDTRTIAREIAEQLETGGYLKGPYVSVVLQESVSKRISVLGAVAKPGTLQLMPGMTIVQAISQAGGFSPLASKDSTVVSRKSGGKLVRHQVLMSKISRGDADDFPLRAGDIIFVPERIF
jgi:protein involved in polysaccharide export with SLBB domain